MCLIAYGPLPSEEICRDAAKSNAHGIGIAWSTKKGVEWEKGLDIEDLFKFPDWIKKWCSVHFRYSTAGAICDGLTHPFPIEANVGLRVTGRAKAILMHNGHVSGWQNVAKNMGWEVDKDKATEAEWSDSRWLAAMVHKYGHEILHMVTGQRILYLTNSEIKLYGHWHKDVTDGVERWYSNLSFRRVPLKSYTSPVEWSKKWWKDNKYVSDFEDDDTGTWEMAGYHGSDSYETWKRTKEARENIDKAIAEDAAEDMGKAKDAIEFIPKAKKYKNKKSGRLYQGSMEKGYLEDEQFIYRRKEHGSGWERFPKLSSLDKDMPMPTKLVETLDVTTEAASFEVVVDEKQERIDKAVAVLQKADEKAN